MNIIISIHHFDSSFLFKNNNLTWQQADLGQLFIFNQKVEFDLCQFHFPHLPMNFNPLSTMAAPFDIPIPISGLPSAVAAAGPAV